jgi:hypothetical protein
MYIMPFGMLRRVALVCADFWKNVSPHQGGIVRNVSSPLASVDSYCSCS